MRNKMITSGHTDSGDIKRIWHVFIFVILMTVFLPVTVLAAGGDFANTDFAAAAPFTYDHATGGGAYNDRTVGDFDDITEQLEGGEFACGDIVTYLAQIEVEANPADPNQIIELDFSFLADSTGQSGAAHSEILHVAVNYGSVQNGAGPNGEDTGISDDGGSTATLISQSLTGPLFQAGSELLATVQIDDLEAGEKVVVRIDVLLLCDPGSSPTGNLQGQLSEGRVISPVQDTINTGEQTIPFLKIGELAGAGEPLLTIQKTVTTANGTCGVDDVESMTVTAGDTVKYCYVLANPGTADLFDLELIDDNGTPASTADDFSVSLSGLSDLDGEGDAGDLASGGTATGEALVTLNIGGTVVNIAKGSGNNGRSGGNFALLEAEDTATVNVEGLPNSPPVASDDSQSTPEETPVTIDVADNDTDPDGNLDLSGAIVLTGPSDGALVNNGDGTFTYTPEANFNGTDSFSYQICDTEGLCDNAIVIIYVTPVNDPPTANDDSATTPEDTPVFIDAKANDSDPDGNLDPSSATVISGPAHGTVSSNGDGTFTYTPDEGFNGTDSFEYQICDADGQCDTATVTITVTPVNDPPVANDDSASTAEDTPVGINAAGNDSDPDGNLDPSGATVISGPSHGTVSNNGDGTFIYTPNPDFNGTDSFTYQICDTDGLCDTAIVNIDVTPVNDPPVANDDTAATDEDIAVTIPVPDNDSAGPASEDPALTVTQVSDPPNGTATINPDGTITYTPDSDFNGTDTFTYTACDSSGACDTATVTVAVASLNDPPVANDDSAGTDEDTPVDISAAANDTDIDGNLDPSSASVLNGPANGTVTGNGDGTFTYTPNPDFNGTDSFTYQICDTDGMCDDATVTINVIPVNDPPVANDDNAGTDEDTPVLINAAANDSDVDGNLDPSSASVVSGPTNGTVTGNGDGTFTYTPNPDFSGADSFIYQICDTDNLCDTAAVNITINPVNDPPKANDDSVSLDEDTSAVINVAANDSDPDGNLDPSTAIVINAPSHGSVTDNGDGTFTYTPDENYNGPDSFSYEICDTDGLCDTATVNITVNPVNDPPVARDDEYETDQDTPLVVGADQGLLPNDSDVDGDLLSVDSFDATSQYSGSVSVNGDGSFTYTPAPGFAGIDTFTYTISDGNGGYDTATAYITVNARNNRSISLELEDFTLSGTSLSGIFHITNQSGGYDVQIIDAEIVVQYRESGPGKKLWTDVVVDGCTFDPSPLFMVSDEAWVDFSGCELAEAIPAGATVRVTARVKIFGRFMGAKKDGWFLSRLSKQL